MKSITVSVPACVGGVNARDSLAAMPPTDAIIMDNWFPQPSYVSLRNGKQLWASGLPTHVNTVMAYNGLPTRKLMAASGTAIYDITAQGAVGAAVVTGLSTDKLQHAMFNAGGGNFLIWVNGLDTPQYFDGTSWHACVMTGPGSPANLITITVHQQRCWYIENNTMNVWYAPITGFQGALTLLPLGTLFKMGGYLMQMASWTIQNVAGISDYAAFITTEGEVALYQGYDPSQVSTWSLVGIFRIGRPIGRRCYTKLASDIAVITADGLTSLNAAVLTDRVDADKQLTFKILNAINADVQNYNANFGWQVIDYPLGNKIIVNVPEVTNTTAHQWVQNPISRAWCRFRNWNANCWELQQDSLYYGENTQVFLADQGQSDAGMAILEDCKPAFSYFEKPGVEKRFVMARPIFQSNSNLVPTVTLNVDWRDIQGSPTTVNSAAGSPWNSSPWNTSPWATGNIFISNWQGIAGLGYVASGRITLQTNGVAANWFSTDYMFEPGGPL